MNAEILIKETSKSDYSAIIEIEELAFDGKDVAELTEQLLDDSSAKPVVSLLAYYDEKAVGHILFTKASIKNNKSLPNAYILAPLAVKPNYQNKGIGKKLIMDGLDRLKKKGIDLVFVLGHIEYYPKFGFINNAEKLGFKPPFPIPKKVADAWMVKTLTKIDISEIKGQIVCANAMNKPEHWRE